VASDAAIETAIAPDRAAALIADGAEAIDIRSPQEWAEGRIAGARHIEINELSDAAGSIADDRPVIFYCRSGDRSELAAEAFRNAGRDAYNMAGGLQAWVGAGLDLDPVDGVVADREIGT
jgi:rhodanese-related sulfurtransferase